MPALLGVPQLTQDSSRASGVHLPQPQHSQVQMFLSQTAWRQREATSWGLLHREPPGMLQPLFKGEDLPRERVGEQGKGWGTLEVASVCSSAPSPAAFNLSILLPVCSLLTFYPFLSLLVQEIRVSEGCGQSGSLLEELVPWRRERNKEGRKFVWVSIVAQSLLCTKPRSKKCTRISQQVTCQQEETVASLLMSSVNYRVTW